MTVFWHGFKFSLVLSLFLISMACQTSYSIKQKQRNPLSVDIKDNDKELFEAIEQDDVALVRTILDRKNTSIVIRNIENKTPLIIAAGKGNSEIVSLLLDELHKIKYLFRKKSYLNAKDNYGGTALIKAVRYPIKAVILEGSGHNHTTVIEFLLKQKGIDPNVQNTMGDNALMRASWTGDVEIINALLSHDKIDLNLTNSIGLTALMLAAWAGHSDILESLLQNGADLHIKANNGTTVFHFAQDKEIRQLLDTYYRERNIHSP